MGIKNQLENNNMYKVSAVSYHNTKPMIYGLQQTGFIHQMDLQLDIPAVTASPDENYLNSSSFGKLFSSSSFNSPSKKLLFSFFIFYNFRN
jgi:hypothetical protein